MSFGIAVLSHTCTLTPHQGVDHQHKLQLKSDSASIQLQHAQGFSPPSHALHKLHVDMYMAASLSNYSTTTGKVLVKNVERKIMYSFIAENDLNYILRKCSLN